MEQNLFFGTILKSLGLEVISTGARVFGSGTYNGWYGLLDTFWPFVLKWNLEADETSRDHQVLLVGMDKYVYYMVDVGFGCECWICIRKSLLTYVFSKWPN